MTVYVLTFPGSNCDQDAVKAIHYLGYRAEILWHQDTCIPSDARLVIVPGGFSWGDYLRCGAMGAISPIITALKRYAQDGGYVLGICNGFQILCEAKLLEGTLLRNREQDFIARPCYLKVENQKKPWLSGYVKNQIVNFPIAHHDGCFWADDATIERLEDNHQILLRYCNEEGQIDELINPNGSKKNIAAICNARGNVVGMMPHPERNVDPVISWNILAGSGAPLFHGIMETMQ